MPWDDALEHLAAYVKTNFGDAEFDAAAGRAMTAMTSHDLVVDRDPEGEDVIASPNGELYDINADHDALRLELQRLIAPH